MTPDQLAAIQRLREAEPKATPAPWRVILPGDLGWDARRKYRCVLFDKSGYDTSPLEPADARFIAAAREGVPALLALVDELREAMEEMRTFALHMDGCQFVHDLRTTDDPLQQVRGQCDCGFDEADAAARALLNATGGSDDARPARRHP